MKDYYMASERNELDQYVSMWLGLKKPYMQKHNCVYSIYFI